MLREKTGVQIMGAHPSQGLTGNMSAPGDAEVEIRWLSAEGGNIVRMNVRDTGGLWAPSDRAGLVMGTGRGTNPSPSWRRIETLAADIIEGER